MREELLISDLVKAFQPSNAISDQGDTSHWRGVSYRCGEIRGTMLAALGDCSPEDIRFDPGLKGWYRVYVSLPTLVNMELWMRLSHDPGFFRLQPMRGQRFSVTGVEEVLWRQCDMTGQSVILSRKDMSPYKVLHSLLAWLRFVPMDDAEVQAHLLEQKRKDTKRIYATDDIHNRLFRDRLKGEKSWDSAVLPYEDSDVEWFSMEDIALSIGGKVPTGDPDRFAFFRSGDRFVEKQIKDFDSLCVLTDLVKTGHERGLKMSVSLRMGIWTMGFPFSKCYYDNSFFFNNPRLWCAGRDGVPIPSLSYAYEEVQDFMIRRLVTLAGTGCDALTLISHRGGPYVQFEKPVVDRFVREFGENPCTLPLDEPRLNGLHCAIMTEFFQKLRRALDEAFPERHVEIHLRALASVHDSKCFGLDCEALAQKGLVDAIICYPQRYREIVRDEFFHDGRIDLEEYKKFVYSENEQAYYHANDLDFWNEPVPDSDGVVRTPKNLRQCVEEWMDLEHRFGVKIYMEILPRVMPPEELQSRALELYEYGAERIGLWDTYDRVCACGMWALARKLGHKKELAEMSPPYFRKCRIHELEGLDITRNHPNWGG